jgi:hypothetical protein
MGDQSLKALEAGVSVEVTVQASLLRNRTGVAIQESATYLLEVRGDQHWFDAWIETDADGYSRPWLKLAEGLRRVPAANWFALVGTLDGQPETAWVIGRGSRHTATASGELVCFANDMPCMYWNNWGALVLTVTRLT